MSDYNVQASVKIKASPAEWGTMIELFNNHQWIKDGRPTRPTGNIIERYTLRGSMHMPPDTNPVYVWLNKSEGGLGGEITAHKIPTGSLLTLLAKDDDWFLVKESWKLLYAEMVRQDFDPQLVDTETSQPIMGGDKLSTPLRIHVTHSIIIPFSTNILFIIINYFFSI